MHTKRRHYFTLWLPTIDEKYLDVDLELYAQDNPSSRELFETFLNEQGDRLFKIERSLIEKLVENEILPKIWEDYVINEMVIYE